jgi:hypothetical protein
MPGCYELDHDEGRQLSKDITAFELRARPLSIVDGQQHYAMYVARHPIRYGEWSPLLGSALRITIATHPARARYLHCGDRPAQSRERTKRWATSLRR